MTKYDFHTLLQEVGDITTCFCICPVYWSSEVRKGKTVSNRRE